VLLDAPEFVRMRFFWLGVDVALMLGVRMQKAPPRALRMSLILFIDFGCGGTQPPSFRGALLCAIAIQDCINLRFSGNHPSLKAL
jgi:hypothetical protein